MTTPTVPQPPAFGSVEHFAESLRKATNINVLQARVLGAVGSIVAAEAKTLVTELRNLLTAEQIVAAELDAQVYQRELDPEQTGKPIPAHVEGHGELGRGSEAWS